MHLFVRGHSLLNSSIAYGFRRSRDYTESAWREPFEAESFQLVFLEELAHVVGRDVPDRLAEVARRGVIFIRE